MGNWPEDSIRSKSKEGKWPMKKRTKKKIAIILAIITFACVLSRPVRYGLAGIFLNIITYEKQDMSDLKFKEEIESLTGLSFPKSTKWIKYQLDRGMDYGFYASFTISRTDVALLFKDMEIEWSSTTRNVHDVGPKWFRPRKIKKFKSFKMRYPNKHSVLKVIYDNSNASDTTGDVLFYIEWFDF